MLKNITRAVVLVICAFPNAATAQKKKTVGLQGIVSGKGYHSRLVKSVDTVWANSRGGEILCTIERFKGFREQVRVRWKFARDVAVMAEGGAVSVTVQIDVSRPGGTKKQRDRNNYSAAGNGGIAGLAKRMEKRFPGSLKRYGHYVSGGFQRLFARKENKPALVGSTTYQVRVARGLSDKVYCAMHFGVMDFYYVGYVYRVGVPATKAKLGTPPKTLSAN